MTSHLHLVAKLGCISTLHIFMAWYSNIEHRLIKSFFFLLTSRTPNYKIDILDVQHDVI